MQKDNQIAGIEMELSGQKKVRTSEIVEQLQDVHLQQIFYSTLKDLKLETEYRQYLSRVGGIQSEQPDKT
jgi:hypothetical protein